MAGVKYGPLVCPGMGQRGWPTLETLGLLLGVFALQSLLALLNLGVPLALSEPLLRYPWTILTSVYAHGGPGHLLANGVALALLGPLVARRTTRAAFHGFFVTTGALAGVAEVVLGGLVGPDVAVLGASGAVFALLGYLLSGNVVSTVVLDRISLSTRAQLALFLAVAVLVTLATARPGLALFGHATGLLCGLLAGRGRLIDAASGSGDGPRSGEDAGRL